MRDRGERVGALPHENPGPGRCPPSACTATSGMTRWMAQNSMSSSSSSEGSAFAAAVHSIIAGHFRMARQ